jgi:hypothetical protein
MRTTVCVLRGGREELVVVCVQAVIGGSGDMRSAHCEVVCVQAVIGGSGDMRSAHCEVQK